jgi:hypothetical protein
MKRLVLALVPALLLFAQPSHACSAPELVQKIKTYGDAVKAAFTRDQPGDAARQAKAMTVIERYRDLKKSTNGTFIIDMTCQEYDELLALYR